jgi:taurine dioxygenase
MSITVRPFTAGLGADISGVDIREPLSTADRDAIRAAWLANLVLRFRDQPMTDTQHMAFTRQFGELEFNPAALIAKQYGVDTQTAGRKHEIPPEISVISNIIEDGKAIGGLGDGEAFWHTDSSFVDVPPAASLLRSLQVPSPSAGGATSFLNCYTAHDTLAEETKKRIAGLTMIHAATHSSGGKAHKGFENVDDVSRVPGARQPMVRMHPETGKKSPVPGPPHQRLCHRAASSRERGVARRAVGAHDPGEVHLEAGVEGRRPGLVGQPLRHAPPRRLRSVDAPADASYSAERHSARLTVRPVPSDKAVRGLRSPDCAIAPRRA